MANVWFGLAGAFVAGAIAVMHNDGLKGWNVVPVIGAAIYWLLVYANRLDARDIAAAKRRRQR